MILKGEEFSKKKLVKSYFRVIFENLPHYYLGSAFFKNLGVTMKGERGKRGREGSVTKGNLTFFCNK